MDFLCWKKMLLMHKKVKQKGFGVCDFLFLICPFFPSKCECLLCRDRIFYPGGEEALKVSIANSNFMH